jgi:hypothetical protein
MLAYLLEYYSENSMNHIGWMINVKKNLHKLPGMFIIQYNSICHLLIYFNLSLIFTVII